MRFIGQKFIADLGKENQVPTRLFLSEQSIICNLNSAKSGNMGKPKSRKSKSRIDELWCHETMAAITANHWLVGRTYVITSEKEILPTV